MYYVAPPDGLGTRIRSLREKRGLNQEGLARTAGLKQSLLSRIELGHRHPYSGQLLQIAGALRVSVYYLLTGESKDPYHGRSL